MSLSATSPWFWKTSTGGDSSISLGSLFQYLTMLSEEKFLLNYPASISKLAQRPPLNENSSSTILILNIPSISRSYFDPF